jgi:hypothetical protein
MLNCDVKYGRNLVAWVFFGGLPGGRCWGCLNPFEMIQAIVWKHGLHWYGQTPPLYLVGCRQAQMA